MNPEIKSRWVEALRSGKYKQGTHFLLQGDRYCCLGVLSDLVKDEVGGKWENRWGTQRFIVGDNYSVRTLTSEVMKYCEVSGLGRYLVPDKIKGQFLSDDNDNGKSFEEIADIIEKYL